MNRKIVKDKMRQISFRIALSICAFSLSLATHAQTDAQTDENLSAARAPRALFMPRCQDSPEQVSALKEKAQSGDIPSRLAYAKLLMTGQCVAQQLDMSIQILSDIAASENSRAEVKDELSCALLRRGNQDDVKEALFLLIESANANSHRAMMTLSKLHRFGVGVPKDDRKADEWIESAGRLLVQKRDQDFNHPSYHIRNGAIISAGYWLRNAVCLEPDYDSASRMKDFLITD